MRVEFSPEAIEQIERRRDWWRANRDERDLFDEELTHAVAYLADHGAALAIVTDVGGHAIRRHLLPKARCHLYFEVRGDVVVVVSAWGANMAKPPPLRR